MPASEPPLSPRFLPDRSLAKRLGVASGQLFPAPLALVQSLYPLHAPLGMVLGMNAMWLLMASDGQLSAQDMRIAAGVVKRKLNTVFVGKKVLGRVS